MAEAAPEKKESAVLSTLKFGVYGDLTGGSLELTDSLIRVRSRKTLIKRAEIKATVPLDAIDSFSLAENEPAVTLTMTAGEKQVVKFDDIAQARGLVSQLKAILGPLDEISRSEQARQEEEKRKQEEAAERKQQLLERISVCVWGYAESLRLVTQAVYRILDHLKTEKWIAVKEEYQALWKQADALQTRSGFALVPSLNDLGKACNDSNGTLAAQSAMSFFEKLKDFCTQAPADLREFEKEDLPDIYPQWSHIRYYFLTCGLLNDAVLGSELGSWASAEGSLASLQKVSVILAVLFGTNIETSVSALGKAIEEKSTASIRQRCDEVQALLHASAESHQFRKVNESNGTMPAKA